MVVIMRPDYLWKKHQNPATAGSTRPAQLPSFSRQANQPHPAMINPKLLKRFHVEPGTEVNLKDYVTDWTDTDEAKELGKDAIRERAKEILEESRIQLAAAQELLYAADTHSVLIILQAMDAAGKDGTIRHVMAGVNPQGCQVFSFKKPSAEELDHNFLWRYMKSLPERGRIGIFNRSYYEDVLVVKVHPEWLGPGSPAKPDKRFWDKRYEDINNFEKHLARNGTLILKFFLHLSKDEQRRRFLERLTNPEKHWKFSEADIAEREHWKEYRKAFEDALTATSTKRAPWHVIPADRKYVARAIVADIITTAIQDLGLKYPTVDEAKMAQLGAVRERLEKEIADKD
jgi:PPK2 family polyphosphate:nucleotide phosphotransferase